MEESSQTLFQLLNLGLALLFVPSLPTSLKFPSKSCTFSDFIPQIALLTWEAGTRKFMSHCPRRCAFSEVSAYWSVSGQGEARSL